MAASTDEVVSQQNNAMAMQQEQESSYRQTIEVQRRLLAKTKTDKSNSIAKNNIYDAVGSNGIFTASPSVIKFAGFQTRKTHTLKLRLINNSPAPQRLHILPPQTPYFKVRYNKKGMVPTGIAEEIYVQFTPNDEYKYYYDSIRIHCEGDKILIPMHAFPVINSNNSELFPSMIDMGKGCVLGQEYNKVLYIDSNCPVDFEYDITVKKAHPDIQITPMTGDIKGLQTTEFTFKYVPKTYTTADAEIEIRTSEFDSQPKLIRIFGSAISNKQITSYQQDLNLQRSIQQQQQDQDDMMSDSAFALRAKTLLKDKTLQKKTVILEKIPSKTTAKHMKSLLQSQRGSISEGANGSVITMKESEHTQADQSIIQLKNVKLSKDEQKFLKEYRQLEELEREKGIKFFVCIGDPPITDERVQEIENGRVEHTSQINDVMRNNDCNRFETAINSDSVVVDTNVDITAKPKWDAFENNHFAMRRRLVAIFLKVCNRLIIRMRAGKRLTQIKARFEQAGVRNRDDARKLVAQDYKDAQNLRAADEEAEDDIKNVQFQFNFNASNIKKSQMRLPLEYETNIASFMEKVEAHPPISFDDLLPFDHVEMLEFEVEKYQPFPVPPMSQFDPAELDKDMRLGCEYESIVKTAHGEPELEKIQLAAYHQQKLLKKDKKDIVSGANVKMPTGFTKPIDFSVDLLVKEHPTLREYTKQSNSTEVDTEFNLAPQKRTRQQQSDEISLVNAKGGQENQATGYNTLALNKTACGLPINNLDIPTQFLPGNFGVRVIDVMPTSISDVYRERQNNKNAYDNFACEQAKEIIPNLMDAPAQVDYLTDDESDEGNDFDLQVPDLDELLQEFEKDDDVIQKKKEAFEETLASLKAKGLEKENRQEIESVRNDKIKMFDNNISSQRQQMSTQMPSMNEDLNEVIKNPSNKIYL